MVSPARRKPPTATLPDFPACRSGHHDAGLRQPPNPPGNQPGRAVPVIGSTRPAANPSRTILPGKGGKSHACQRPPPASCAAAPASATAKAAAKSFCKPPCPPPDSAYPAGTKGSGSGRPPPKPRRAAGNPPAPPDPLPPSPNCPAADPGPAHYTGAEQ